MQNCQDWEVIGDDIFKSYTNTNSNFIIYSLKALCQDYLS